MISCSDGFPVPLEGHMLNMEMYNKENAFKARRSENETEIMLS